MGEREDFHGSSLPVGKGALQAWGIDLETKIKEKGVKA
jgi:hypothetical protein